MTDDYPIPDMDDTEDELEAEIARLREWIVMAHNRLECKDCSQCVAVARSYLREALASKHSPRRGK